MWASEHDLDFNMSPIFFSPITRSPRFLIDLNQAAKSPLLEDQSNIHNVPILLEPIDFETTKLNNSSSDIDRSKVLCASINKKLMDILNHLPTNLDNLEAIDEGIDEMCSTFSEEIKKIPL